MEKSLLYLKELTAGNFVEVLEEDFANGEIIDDLYDEGNLKFKDKPGFKTIKYEQWQTKIEFQDESSKIIKLSYSNYLIIKVRKEVETIKKAVFAEINSLDDIISRKEKLNFLRDQFNLFYKLWNKKEYMDEHSSVGFIFLEMEDIFRTDGKSIESKKVNKSEENWKKIYDDGTFASEGGKVSNFTWEKSDTDLLELITVLIESKAINNSTKNLTRKEAIEAFSQFFNLEIKDAESKLSRATTRTNPTKFIDELKNSLEEYIDKKFD